MNDPVTTDPDHYRILLENERVRVLEYRDEPGETTHVHAHPDSVMVALSTFDRSITSGEREVPVHLDAGEVRWLDAQSHRGRNTGPTPTRSVFVELKEPAPSPSGDARLGPQTG